jgi:non-lysosomal glucosylceramidase
MPSSSRINRRKFLQNAGLLTTGLLTARLPAKALSLRPWGTELEKKLPPSWVQSLYERGGATTYLKSRNELQYIGMPVGGINCGTVYLGGDGRLWLWDIFNKNQEGIEPKEVQWSPDRKAPQKVRSRDGACYVEPSKDIRPLQQGFAVLVEWEGQQVVKNLSAEDWNEIAFEATYPMATIRYTDAHLPVTISLQVYSPFIALDEHNSGLPATIFSFHVHNTSSSDVKVSMLGWLENKAGLYTANTTLHERVNTTSAGDGFCSTQGTIKVINGKTDTQLTQNHDFGTLAISAFDKRAVSGTNLRLPLKPASFIKLNNKISTASPDQTLLASVLDKRQLQGRAMEDFHFVVAWHFPNLELDGVQGGKGRYYQNQFKDATAVIAYIHSNFDMLRSQSQLWKDTWYDSTLPWWFMERTFQNVSTLATTTCHRFPNGRFWAWEGVGACPGNCTHVWQYAQASGRIFPALERDTRERIDLGLAQEPDGGIWFRAELEKRPAIDGQAGTVLRFYREHQLTKDNAFLQRNWPNIKRAVQFIIAQDKNGDGMEDTPMENTLDAVWHGEIAWIVGLCIAGVRAGQAMAEEAGDTDFANTCKSYVDKGRRNMEEKLFNGEYFIHRPDATEGRKELGSYNTSHIDQVFGQSWAFQVGLGRVLDEQKTRSALQSLWKYNFTTDVGPYISKHQGGRPYAVPGEGGMIMNTNPNNDPNPYGEDVTWQAGYFNECMSGFEHQVAAHMMAEGMTEESLIITRTIHDRYHAVKRNPFNEIECSDHYARAMASYGTFITACGFEYHGPKQYIRFAPKLSPDNFKAPFTAAEGWGSYTQQRSNKNFTAHLELKYGTLALKEFGVTLPQNFRKNTLTTTLQGASIPCRIQQRGDTLSVIFSDTLNIKAGESLIVNIG